MAVCLYVLYVSECVCMCLYMAACVVCVCMFVYGLHVMCALHVLHAFVIVACACM